MTATYIIEWDWQRLDSLVLAASDLQKKAEELRQKADELAEQMLEAAEAQE